MPVIDVKKLKTEIESQSPGMIRTKIGKNQRDTSRKTNFSFRSQNQLKNSTSFAEKMEVSLPVRNIKRQDIQLQYSAKIGRRKKKRHVEITTAMGQENVFVSTCPLEIAGKVESKHVAILPKLQNQKYSI